MCTYFKNKVCSLNYSCDVVMWLISLMYLHICLILNNRRNHLLFINNINVSITETCFQVIRNVIVLINFKLGPQSIIKISMNKKHSYVLNYLNEKYILIRLCETIFNFFIDPWFFLINESKSVIQEYYSKLWITWNGVNL